MTRPIRFRGKSIDNGQWVYGYVEIFTNPMGKSGAVIHTFSDWNLNSPVEVDSDTISQFIGLTDKKCKEIYEGDILEYEYGSQPITTYYVKIIWNSQRAKFQVQVCPDGVIMSMSNIAGNFKVVGDIYSNPELLK